MGEYDEYDENLDWDIWAGDAFQDDQSTQPKKADKKTKGATPNKRYQLPIDWGCDPENKSERMKEELKRLQEEKMLKRMEQAKKISWKEIGKNMEYEILVGGESLGRVKMGFKGKWKIHPSFSWRKNSYNRYVVVEAEYADFHDSGKALVDLWTVS